MMQWHVMCWDGDVLIRSPMEWHVWVAIYTAGKWHLLKMILLMGQALEPLTCCVATVKIAGGSSRALKGSNATMLPIPMFSNPYKRFCLHGHCRGVLGIFTTSSPKSCAMCMFGLNHRQSWVDDQVNSIYALHQNIYSVTMPMCGIPLSL